MKRKCANRPPWRREKIEKIVCRGDLAVAVPVEVVFPDENWLVPCYEAATVDFLEEVARKLEAGDMKYLQSVGEVFRALKPTQSPTSRSSEPQRPGPKVKNTTGSRAR